MAIFAKFSKVQGAVVAKGFENHIELTHAGYFASRVVSTDVGTGRNREAGIPTMQDFHIMKRLDKASPKLWLSSLVGKAIDKVEVKFVKTSEDVLETYLTFTLEDALVSSYSLSDYREGHAEVLTLAYNKILMKYSPRKSDNSLGDPIPGGYDVKHGKKI